MSETCKATWKESKRALVQVRPANRNENRAKGEELCPVAIAKRNWNQYQSP